jgi:hypothetical protein
LFADRERYAYGICIAAFHIFIYSHVVFYTGNKIRMTTKYLYILSFFLCCSCISILKKKYEFTKRHDFKSRKEYESFIAEKFDIKSANLLFADSAYYDSFMHQFISAQKSSFFYGLFLNDSTEISFAAQTDKNCIGQVNKAIQLYNRGIDSFATSTNNVFKIFLFRRLDGDSVFVYPKTKASAFFVYGYSMGNYFDKYFNQINSTLSKDSCNFFIILLDPVQRLSR